MDNIPDFSLSFIPVNQQSLPLQNTMPKAPDIMQPKDGGGIQGGLMDLIKSGALKGSNGQSGYQSMMGAIGGANTGQGFGTTLENLWKGSSMGGGMYGPGFNSGGKVSGADLMKKYGGHKAHALIAHHWGTQNTDNWLARGSNHTEVPMDTQSFVDNALVGGDDKGFSSGGGIMGYSRGGWESQLLYDKPLYSTPVSLSAEEMGILPSGGTVGGLPLNPTMNNRLAMDMMRDPSMGTQGPQPQQTPATIDGGTSAFGGNFNMNPYAGFKDPATAPSATATPSDMQALLAAQQKPSGGMTSSTIPDAPQSGIQVAQNQVGVASDAPPALDDLKSQLDKNAPVLDKWQAIALAGAGMMASKNRHALGQVGEGVQQGLLNYGEQKTAVREYALKQAEVEKQAQQLAMEAARYNKQLSIEQENADTNKDYKNITAKVAQQNVDEKDIVKIKDALGTEHLVKKSDLINGQKDGAIAGAQNADGTFSTIPDKAVEAWKESGLSPTSPPINKFQAKALSQHYDDAVKADQGARDASVMVDKIYPALQNYSAGMGSEFRSNAMAAASSLFNAKAPDFATNAQEINKVSGTIATQLASQMPSGSRVGIGVDNLFKSTTISPTNTPEANMWIAKNIKDAPAVTAQVVGIKSYLAENNISPAHANAIEQKFYKENPIMVPSGAGKGIDRVNPKFKDPSFFYKWISGKEGSSEAALDKSDPKVQKALDAGYTEDEIRQHLGQ